MYENGIGIKKDIKRAVSWYKKSVKQNYLQAHYNMGRAYVHGYGLKQDFKKGIKHFHKAAEKGHGKAQMDLGVAYYTGKGVAPDSAIAYAWFYVAAATNVNDARKTKNALYNKLTAEDKKKAVSLATEYKRKYFVRRLNN